MTQTKLSIIYMIMASLLLFSGCTNRCPVPDDCVHRFYIPQRVPIRPAMLEDPDFPICTPVTIVNDQPDQDNIWIGDYTHQWVGNLRIWTTTSMGVLKSELQRKGVTVTEDAPKAIRLSVTNINLFWKFRSIGCKIQIRVETGEGYVADYIETNATTDLYTSCDGAVTRAVAAIMNDKNIIDYLKCPLPPKDSDCDGVPDTMDQCPETPKGIDVDINGCPLDSDGDGIPNNIDKCPGTEKGAKIDIKGCPLDSDMDQVYDYLDKCPDTPLNVPVDKTGCPRDSDKDGAPDIIDKCPGTPEGIKVDSSGCPVD